MQTILRATLLTLATLALSGCYVDGPGPYRGAHGYDRRGPYVEGHFGPNGFWIPGRYR